MKKKILLILKFVFFLSLGFFFIWWFQRKLSVTEKLEISQSFQSANYLWVVLAIIPGIFSHLSRAVRWRMLLKPMGYKPKVSTTFAAVMIGYFANLAFPRLGEVMRCGILHKYEKIPVSKSFGTVITERTIDMIIFLLLFMFTFILEFNNLKDYLYENLLLKFSDKFTSINFTGFLSFTLLSILLILVLLFIIFKPKIIKSNIYIKTMVFVLGFVEGIKSLSKIDKPYWFVFHSLFIWLNYFLMTWLIFFCFDQTATLGLNVALSALVLGSVGIMLVPGGIGIYPVIISQTLLIFSIAKTTGYALGWIAWSSQTALIIISGLISLAVLPLIKKQNHDSI